MDTLSELRQAIQDDLTVDDGSTLYAPALINRAINRAYIKCATLYRWPQLEDAKKTSTQSGVETYDYPSTWRPDSIWRLEVDNEQYGEDPDGSPLDFSDYQTWRRDEANSGSTDKKWANQKTRYFVYPVPTTSGTNNISVWGIKNVTALSDDTDTTAFSYNMPECNEAVVLEAIAILKGRGDDDKGEQFKSLEAKGILTTAFNKLKQEQTKYERNQPMFQVQDFFANNRNPNVRIGNF